ncbi:hypothetical protein L211DRAFT_682195 [Terfezia boudieri ATCC MYA-4762]|uniref:REJ domain-containing protein n=1 Tax=Terfezia boudieri ATCC MYA-4762 TaxID=1051890 RepID=A0A3N4LUF5_9PEZI|nr:hypothetical protein L211DRAFT_682195 [Terfezia boudieri ATCC MYA-4762]
MYHHHPLHRLHLALLLSKGICTLMPTSSLYIPTPRTSRYSALPSPRTRKATAPDLSTSNPPPLVQLPNPSPSPSPSLQSRSTSSARSLHTHPIWARIHLLVIQLNNIPSLTQFCPFSLSKREACSARSPAPPHKPVDCSIMLSGFFCASILTSVHGSIRDCCCSPS